ncbi:hypothetical protein HDU87_000743 [Geranomyces variabilis]|uniref:NAD(P)-binding protein n=1 Tax=Geranomyces variabilis TaxID=109894 RepID=A0AAD5TNL4_9FUNG|nr:hypothetical protein HDU87_000743 [Geranomyces variabilis]
MVLLPSSNRKIYAECHERNEKVSLKGKNAVVVGGTGGIGLAIAARLASLGANIVIVGRNEGVAASIAPQPGATKTFIRCDVSLQANIRLSAAEIQAVPSIASSGIDCLVLVCGKTMNERVLTSEGRETFMAITFWARMLFTQILLPEVAKGDGVVMNVHGGGQDAKDMKPIDVNDFDLKNISFSFLNAARFSRIATDGMFQEFAARNAVSNVRFIHAFPGMVKTAGYNDCPLTIRSVIYILGPLMWTASASESADVMVDVMLKPRPTEGSTFEVWNNLGKEGAAAGWVRTDPNASKSVYDAAAKIANF